MTPADTTTTPVFSEPAPGQQQRLGAIVFGAVLVAGAAYVGSQLLSDLSHVRATSTMPFLLLALALSAALAFEFVNGFHDTANAVATVIYTNSLPPTAAVVLSGVANLTGVMASSGVVAFGIISLLPVELILQVGSGAGFAMVFALLVAAIIWNVGTWYFGLPASSSHTLIGSIIGVGLANQLMATHSGTSGVDWSQAAGVGRSLLLSPIIGFVAAGLLLLMMKALIPSPPLYTAPRGDAPPPWWIRSLLILTCTGVSFTHGSNDGQKGMGLIMLILIGTVPTAYALNYAVSPAQVQAFVASSDETVAVLARRLDPGASIGDPNLELSEYLSSRLYHPPVLLGLQQLVNDVAREVEIYGELRKVPPERVRNFRNDLYLIGETLRLMDKSHEPAFSDAEWATLRTYRSEVDSATRFIPSWVKVAVALALGLGTMIGWKRIVVTVGEKIGKSHLTYAQGAAAELTTMATIGGADYLGLPVSTTHVLSSGVAGTMAANRSGVQWGTVKNLALAWVLTLPASVALSGLLYYVFRSAVE